MPTAPALRGRIIEWHDDRGFGYLQGPRGRVFVHVRDFAEQVRRPRIGDELSYVMGTDKAGRPCAVNVIQEGFGGSFGLGSLIVLLALLILPVLAAKTWLEVDRFWLVVGLSAVMSIACFLVYYADKRSARSGAWRVPENVLHFLELCGGWPGLSSLNACSATNRPRPVTCSPTGSSCCCIRPSATTARAAGRSPRLV